MSKTQPLTADQLRDMIRARMDVLRPLVEECRALEAASAALGSVAAEPAPYGRKTNGEPRRRPGRKPTSPRRQAAQEATK